uniref:Uncharacterized protein n=1 Tax=Rhizophora mucronata TaxID=61149 RepID=A0A2P2QEJ2_RHIMU
MAFSFFNLILDNWGLSFVIFLSLILTA